MNCPGYDPPDDSILIVTGSTLRAEEMDRPLAYNIRQKILAFGELYFPPPVYVISDLRYMYDENDLRSHPTISIGGPGVNALAHCWLKELPIVVEEPEEQYIQITEPRIRPPRASIWGFDHETTKVALGRFVSEYLEPFLNLCPHRSAKR